jgi:alkylhydroperoxidase family enzyme
MRERVYLPKVAPDTYAAIRALDATVRRSGLEPSLIELVKMRASQVNGCAFCLDMHAKDARAW